MKKIAGIGLFIASWVLVIYYFFFGYEYLYDYLNDYGIVDIDDILFIAWNTSLSISSVSAIYYVVATKFGNEVNDNEKIDIETRIIKAQIEKKELLATLEALEKNG
ncbi:hypothetical protein [Aquiflexum sp.]|uniref:hypothetical protein n=1 Tax=Aquiflexum sp. TaxID=1872584 RepID=UPI0035941A98